MPAPSYSHVHPHFPGRPVVRLTGPDFTKKYWFGFRQQSDWKARLSWKLIGPDGGPLTAKVDAPRRLVLKWRNEFRPEVEIEPVGDVKLTITRAIDRDQSNFIDAVSGGWPRILANLKYCLRRAGLCSRSACRDRSARLW
jgi:hypothetical protein